jgi:hypothetical protein
MNCHTGMKGNYAIRFWSIKVFGNHPRQDPTMVQLGWLSSFLMIFREKWTRKEKK